MSLDHILLGILREPAAGYDIKQYFEQVFRHFWSADASQIYRTLNRLERDGFLESRSEPSAKGPDRRVYAATAKGQQELLRWLHDGPLLGSEKFTYLAQVFFLGEANDLELSERFFESLRDEFSLALETLRNIETGWSEDPQYPDRLDHRDFHRQMTLAMGLAKNTALLGWAETMLQRIRDRRLKQGGQQQKRAGKAQHKLQHGSEE